MLHGQYIRRVDRQLFVERANFFIGCTLEVWIESLLVERSNASCA